VVGRSADLRLGAEASEGWLRRAPVGTYRVLHFATHALVDARSDAGVALVLSPGDGADGFLTLDEIAALPLRADLVVLAACRTAAGSGRADTPRTLATTFLSAGARSVLATRWPVPDRAAAQFVTAFVAAARPGVPLADALAAAQRARRQAGERSAVWGAFTLVGAGRHTL
jgi:CHAT domain-containing protein